MFFHRVKLIPILFLIFFCFSHAQKSSSFFAHVGFQTFYSRYQGNDNHLTQINPLPAFTLFVKEEIIFSPKTSVIMGAEWFNHGLRFDSYFFYTGQLALYNKQFNYTYRMRWNELAFPFLMRTIISGKMKDRYKTFLDIGPSLRYLLAADVNVSDNQKQDVFSGKVFTPFQPAMKNNAIGIYLNGIAGMEFYKDNLRKGFSIELALKYAPGRLFFRESFTPSGLFFSQWHIGAGISFRL